jgi:hypothetical protein
MKEGDLEELIEEIRRQEEGQLVVRMQAACRAVGGGAIDVWSDLGVFL